MSKHTPGPWTVLFSSHDPLEIWDAPCTVKICTLADVSDNGVEELANARVLAQASELLRIAKFMRDELVEQGTEPCPELADINAVIARAEVEV